MTSRTHAFVLAALATCVSATAAADYSTPTRSTRAQVEPYAGQPVESVARRPLMNSERWEVLGDYSMLVWEGRAKAWLVDFAHDDEQCEDISQDYRMHMNNTISWLNTSSGHVELHNGRWCDIEQIRPVDTKALLKWRKSQGIRSPY